MKQYNMNNFGIFKNSTATQEFKAGEYIFLKGQAGDFMWAVQTGEVEIVDNDKILETVGPGSIFGELALIDNSPRSASARAKTACSLVPVDEKRFTYLVQETPFFALQVLRLLASRLRKWSS